MSLTHSHPEDLREEAGAPAGAVDFFLDRVLLKAVEVLTALLLFADVAVVAASVVWRYGLKDPLPWADEVARLLLIWTTFAGGTVAMHRHGHMSVNVLVTKFSRRWQAFTEGAVLVAQLAFILFLAYQGYKLSAFRMHDPSPALQASMAWFMAPASAFSVIMALLLIRELRNAWVGGRVWAAGGMLTGALVSLLLGSGMFGLMTEVNPVVVLLSITGVLIALNGPIAIALGGASLAYLLLNQNIPLIIVPQRMVAGVDSFPLLALPFFILAGNLMETGGISQRLVDFATALVGHFRGGLAMVVVVTEMLFSGISGSVSADVSAVGSMLIPAMSKAGYDKAESAAIVSAASAMGVLVPPCIWMVVLGAYFNISITDLFLGGFLPATVLGICIMVLIAWKARRESWAPSPRLSWKERLRAFKGAIVPMLMPAIIFGGVLGGVVTVTEAAVVAVVYGAVVGMGVYREIKPKQALKILVDSGVSSGMVLWLVGAASLFSWVLARQAVPAMIGQWIQAMSSNTMVFMTLTCVVFIMLGGVLEGLPAMVILAPIFLPIAHSFGVDPVHFGIVMIAAMGLGVFLPPVGVGLFIAGSIARLDMMTVARKFWVYLAALTIGLLIIAYVPWVTLVIPKMFQ